MRLYGRGAFLREGGVNATEMAVGGLPLSTGAARGALRFRLDGFKSYPRAGGLVRGRITIYFNVEGFAPATRTSAPARAGAHLGFPLAESAENYRELGEFGRANFPRTSQGGPEM